MDAVPDSHLLEMILLEDSLPYLIGSGTSLKIGRPIVPGLEYRKLTTWTSFRLMECNARGLVDIEVQDLINSIAKGDVMQYIDSIKLIAKRGHTSGIDFATGATVGLYFAIDSLKHK